MQGGSHADLFNPWTERREDIKAARVTWRVPEQDTHQVTLEKGPLTEQLSDEQRRGRPEDATGF